MFVHRRLEQFETVTITFHLGSTVIPYLVNNTMCSTQPQSVNINFIKIVILPKGYYQPAIKTEL